MTDDASDSIEPDSCTHFFGDCSAVLYHDILPIYCTRRVIFKNMDKMETRKTLDITYIRICTGYALHSTNRERHNTCSIVTQQYRFRSLQKRGL